MHGQSCSPQRIIFIIWFCLYYWHWKEQKNRKKCGNVKNVQAIRVAQWGEQTSEQAQLWPQCPPQSKQTATSGYGLCVNLVELPNRETFQSRKYHPFYHTMKKSKIMGERKWMSHQRAKPQLALIIRKTHFLWTLLWH